MIYYECWFISRLKKINTNHYYWIIETWNTKSGWIWAFQSDAYVKVGWDHLILSLSAKICNPIFLHHNSQQNSQFQLWCSLNPTRGYYLHLLFLNSNFTLLKSCVPWSIWRPMKICYAFISWNLGTFSHHHCAYIGNVFVITFASNPLCSVVFFSIMAPLTTPSNFKWNLKFGSSTPPRVAMSSYTFTIVNI